MPDYLNKNGETYTEQELIGYAEDEGLTLEEYMGAKTFEVVEPGKINDSSTETPTVESNAMGSKSGDFSSELPNITSEITALGETQGIARLNKMFKGLGWEFKEQPALRGGAGFDRVVAIAPPDADGNRKEQMFEFDLDLGLPAFGKSKNSQGDNEISGDFWESSNALSMDFGAKGVAEDMNMFIKENTNLDGINEQTYNQAWNYANTKEFSKDLTSEELQEEIDNVYTDLMFGDKKLPGADRLFKEINNSLETFAEQTAVTLKDKYDTSKKDQYDLAIKEFDTLIEAEHDRLLKNSEELGNISQGVDKALDSRFGGTVSDKRRTEAENVHLPPWITSFDSDIIRQGYVTANIKFPKAWREINILHHGREMKMIDNELTDLKSKVKSLNYKSGEKYEREQEYTLMPTGLTGAAVRQFLDDEDNIPLEINGKNIYDKYNGTVEDRIKYLETLNGQYNKNLAFNLASQQTYQKKLRDVRVPTAFGKTIDDPDLTIDEWQGMLGDQTVQMVSAALSFGGSTYIQEGGGAAIEILEIEAAMKEFPVGFQQEQLNEFFGTAQDESDEKKSLNLGPTPPLPSSEEWEKMTDKEQQDWQNGVVKPTTADFEQSLKAFRNLKEDKRKELMLEVLQNGEANLKPAVFVGAINAGLDLTSNFVGITKLMKFAPKSLMRNILARDVSKVLKGTKGLGVASLTEAGTELGQEKTSVEGVGFSTGYYGNKQKNLKRYGEAAAQAFLSTGPLIGGGAVVKTAAKDAKANYRAMKDPNDTRNAINNFKSQIDNTYKNGDITLNERNEFFDSLEAEEDVINKYVEYKEMDVNQKETVVNENIKIRSNNEGIAKLEAENKNLKKESTSGLSLGAVKNQVKIEDLQNENRKAQNAINKELKIGNDIKSRKRFVEHVKSNPELYNGATPMDLMTIEKAKKYFKKMNMLDNEGVKRLLAGEVNAFQEGKNVFSIEEMRHKLIRSNKGYGTPNAFHHDILHVIQESMGIKELREMRKEIIKQIATSKDGKLQGLMDAAEMMFEERYGSKFNKTQKNYYLEWMANLSDAMKEYSVTDLTEDSAMDFTRIGNYFSNVFQNKTKVGKDWTNFGPENALEHIKEYTNFYGQRQSLKVSAPKGKVQVDLPKDKVVKEEKGKQRFSEISKKTPEELVKIIQRGQNPKRVKEANEALAPQFELLALSEKGLNYDTRKGDIAREDVVAEAMTYLPGIIKRFTSIDPVSKNKRKFSTFVIANMSKKQQVIYEKVKPLTYGETTSIDTKEAKQIEGDVGTTTNTEKTFVQKINILQDFAIANRVADKIKSLVKVGKDDNFKSIISKYAGKAGELIFEVPAKKIMEGGANLAAVTKYTEGMPAPAEAQNIQRFFNAPNNADKFIKTLPLYNVTDKTADINKVGENLEVSRDTYGYAIGLKGLPLDYFYENYTDPKALSKDPKVYERRVTSKAGRSMGLTSQTPMKRLKPQFRKPTPETVEQLKNDLGITQRNEANVYSRDIGQLLKGVAKVHSINAAISGAQRVQEAKLKTAPATEQKAIKQQTADITAVQSKAAFSEVVSDIVNIRSLFQLEEKGIDKLLQALGVDKTFNLKNKTEVDKFVKAVKKHLLPLMPKDFWFGKSGGTVFTGSSKVVGSTDAAKKLYKEYYEPAMKALEKDKKQKYGKPVKDANGNTLNFSISAYSTIFKDAKTINGNTKGIKAWNKKVATIHEVMWQRFNEAIRSDKENARVIGNYLKMVGSDTKHWHKLGAQFVGHSRKITGTRFEYEHAMPATAAYLYLIDAALSESDFKASYNAVIKNYKLIALDKAMDKKLTSVGLQRRMPIGWDLMQNNWWDRYFNTLVAGVNGGIDPNSIQGLDGKTFGEMFDINKEGNHSSIKLNLDNNKTVSNAIVKARTNKYSEASRGITILDFDDTLATSKSLVKYTKPDGTTGTLNAEQYAKTYEDLLDKGYVFDFSEFNKVVKGKIAPLFNKAIKLQGKFGPENMFVLTARPPQSQKAIFDFLKANGLNIPIKNITGLGNSTAEAKALWVADKVGEGFNDFYFADDALQNVQAVKNMLEQFDVKSKVQQARVNFSETMNDTFNEILENVTKIEAKKRFSAIKGRKRGESKGKFRLFIPPSHEDFVGLLYNFLGKGKEGNAHRNFFEQALVRPLNRANREFDTARQSIANDYKELNKQFEDVRKKLTKKTKDGDFTFQDAIRVYLWDKHGHTIPGLSETDQTSLSELVMSDPKLQAYAETLNVISKQETYVNPTEGWNSGDIRMDLDDATGRVGRAEFFNEFQENADIIFSEENLNKIEAGYGEGVRESLEDMLYRIKTGRNRPSGQNKQVNKLMNYLNGSVGTVMFFNMRSALLQQMSLVNYINFADNNIFAAAKAFANQPQYWKDWSFIFNSDMLKQRRGGIQTDVNGAELAASLRNSKDITRKLISKLLELGFLPTQIGDNVAIATGGATFYRNRINKYIKNGLSQKEAEAKAFTDFQAITQSTQQSARPDMVSKQQASVIGKVILNFQNVTSQFNRLGKKAFQDIYNRRITGPNTTQMQSDISNASRITYYFAIQNAIFYTLQTALFAMMFGDDDEDNNKLFLKKKERLINGSIDSVLRGSGLLGGVVATLKNVAIAFARQRDVKYNPDESAVALEALNLSPVLGIKMRKIVQAEKTLNYNKKLMKQMDNFDIDNPQWSAVTNYTEAITNVPLNRLYNKTQNVRQALNNEHAAWERTLMFLGWSQYNLNLTNSKMESLKLKTKSKKRKGSRKWL